MSCPCASQAADCLPLIRARAAMCHVCPFAEHGPSATRDGAVACTISGRPIGEHIGCRGSCPKGMHPDDAGIVRWLGIRWYGVPMPVRLWIWLTAPKHTRPRAYAGCGCVKALKDLLA